MNAEWWQLLILGILFGGLLSWRIWQWRQLPPERKKWWWWGFWWW